MDVNEAIIDDLFWWMCDGAPPSADARVIVQTIGDRLLAAGIRIDRFALFIFTLHPNILGRRFSWSPGGDVDLLTADFSLFDTDEYADNPLPDVIREKQPIRRKLADPECPRDYKILGELEAEGYTDYLAQPLIYTTGEVHVATWSTKVPGGYSDAAIAALEKIRLPLARLTETYMLRLNAAILLSTYVGRGTGGRILHGRIKRGDTEILRAVILFADLKGFTDLSNTLDGDRVIELLNVFYDAVGPEVEANGGEILKFMGDGMLAMFPVEETRRKAVCQAAIEALSAAKTTLRAANRQTDRGNPELDFRASLHVGDIHYGNIGSTNRLDFTAIGPAVNLAARLLSAASGLNCDLVVSADVAELLPDRTTKIGTVDLRGFDMPQPVHALTERGTP